MMFNSNLKYLRKKKKLTQQDAAKGLGLKRSTLGAYEEGRFQPSLDTLIAMGDFFEVTLDDLIREDLRKKDRKALKNLHDKNLRVLAVSVDKQGRENIEYVPKKADAGYLLGYGDPEYISDLPAFTLPEMPSGTFRAFEVRGDSMLPVQPGSIVIGRFVERWQDIRNNHPHILVTREEGIVFKRVFTRGMKKGQLLLSSDNPEYNPYHIRMEMLIEAWAYYAHIAFGTEGEAGKMEEVLRKLNALGAEVAEIRSRI